MDQIDRILHRQTAASRHLLRAGRGARRRCDDATIAAQSFAQEQVLISVSGGFMYIALLIVHGLIAVALLGAITHQTASAWLPARKPAASFPGRFRAVSAAAYANAIVALYLCA